MTIANVTPAGMLAERHRQIAEPGSGKPETDTGERLKDLSETTLEDLEQILRTNRRGVFLEMRACAPVMPG